MKSDERTARHVADDIVQSAWEQIGYGELSRRIAQALESHGVECRRKGYEQGEANFAEAVRGSKDRLREMLMSRYYKGVEDAILSVRSFIDAGIGSAEFKLLQDITADLRALIPQEDSKNEKD